MNRPEFRAYFLSWEGRPAAEGMVARSPKPNRDQTVHHGALDPASSPRALHPEPLILRTSNGATEAVISRTKSAVWNRSAAFSFYAS
jgi:hypothetical protein